jgi:hypothetical protein
MVFKFILVTGSLVLALLAILAVAFAVLLTLLAWGLFPGAREPNCVPAVVDELGTEWESCAPVAT